MMRRAIVGALVTVLLGAPALAGAADPPPVMFRGDAAHHGVCASGPPPTLRTLAWRFPTRGRVIASPTLAGNTVYVGSDDGHLYALDAQSGRMRWSFASGGPIDSSAAVVDGSVYVASGDGRVYAVDAATGRERWRFTTRGEQRFTSNGLFTPPTQVAPDAYDVLLSSPTVVGGVVYIGSGDHHVYALDAATGAVRWSVRTHDVVHGSPAVVDGTVYIGSFDGAVYALDAGTGSERWHVATHHSATEGWMNGVSSSAVVSADTVYIGARDGHLYALDRDTGSVRWSHDDHGSWVVGAPALVGDTVYITTSDELAFIGLDARTGTERGRFAYGTYAFSSPTICGTRAYFGTFSGIVHAVDVRTYREVGHFVTDASRRHAGQLLDAQGHVPANFYGAGTFEDTVVGVHRLLELGSIIATPAIANGRLYVGSTDGNVYALR